MRERAATRGRRGATDGIVARPGRRISRSCCSPRAASRARSSLARRHDADRVHDLARHDRAELRRHDRRSRSTRSRRSSYDAQRARPDVPDARACRSIVEPGKTTDVGTISVVRRAARSAASSPPTARRCRTRRSTRAARSSATARATRRRSAAWAQRAKTTTTGADGTFSLAGFNDGDLAIIAEQPDIGRSKAMRVPTDQAEPDQLVLELQKFGAISGVLRAERQAGRGRVRELPVDDDARRDLRRRARPRRRYRYDKLAPDTYKVSATVGMPMKGMKFYSKEVVRAAGQRGQGRSRRSTPARSRSTSPRRRATARSASRARGSRAARSSRRPRTISACKMAAAGPGSVAVGDHPARRAGEVHRARARHVHGVRRRVPGRGAGHGGDAATSRSTATRCRRSASR